MAFVSGLSLRKPPASFAPTCTTCRASTAPSSAKRSAPASAARPIRRWRRPRPRRRGAGAGGTRRPRHAVAADAAARQRSGGAGSGRCRALVRPAAAVAAAADCRLEGLPIVKPPYGVLSAIDLDKGELMFQVPHGDTPDAVRNAPPLAGMTIPKTGQGGSVGMLVTKTLVVARRPAGDRAARTSARRHAARLRQAERQRSRRGLDAGARKADRR